VFDEDLNTPTTRRQMTARRGVRGWGWWGGVRQRSRGTGPAPGRKGGMDGAATGLNLLGQLGLSWT